VLAAGATKYDVQPNDHCRVYADPVGHPLLAAVAPASMIETLTGNPVTAVDDFSAVATSAEVPRMSRS